MILTLKVWSQETEILIPANILGPWKRLFIFLHLCFLMWTLRQSYPYIYITLVYYVRVYPILRTQGAVQS